MNQRIKSIIVMVLGVFLAGGVWAQEYGEEAGAVEDTGPIVVESDGGLEAVSEVQSGAASIVFVESISADKQIQNLMKKKKYNEGWDDGKKRFFVKTSSSFNSEDPSYDNTFIVKREIMAKMAVLKAKAEVIEWINSEMSAKEQLTMPGTDVHAELNAEYNKQVKKINVQRRKVAKLLDSVDAAQAAELRGVTFGDHFNILLDAAIRKLDETYSSKDIEQKQRDDLAKAKQRYEEGMAEMASLEEQASTIQGKVSRSFSSEISKHAKMPLFGATCIAQAESYDEDNEEFQVAALFCWSKSLEASARATLLNEPVELTKKPKKQSLVEWLQGQDLSVMVGPRQYLDHEGKRYFIGISARPQGKNSVKNEMNQDLANMFATQMAVFSLKADVESTKKAKQLMQDRSSSGDINKGSVSTVAESMEKALSQGFEKTIIRGESRLYDTVVTHPISGEKMYVVVRGINPSAASAAMQAEVESFATANEVARHQQFEKGRKVALDQSYDEAKVDRAAYNKGHQSGSAAVQTEENSRKPQVKTTKKGSLSNSKKTSGTGSTVSGSYMSGTDDDDDF